MATTKQNTDDNFTKYEVARMIGSRALQLSMGAPFLVKLVDEELKKINFDPIEIAILELNEGVLPITIRRPLARRASENTEENTAA